LCKRFGPGVLPSQVLAEDAGVLRMLDVFQLGTPEEPQDGGEDEYG
jgi:hypothetical protein